MKKNDVFGTVHIRHTRKRSTHHASRRYPKPESLRETTRKTPPIHTKRRIIS